MGLVLEQGSLRLCRAPGSALPPVPEQLHLREADAPGSVCLHLPYVQARLAGRVSEPAPNHSRSQPLSPLQGMLLLLTPPQGRGCRHPKAESHPPGFAPGRPCHALAGRCPSTAGHGHAFTGHLPSLHRRGRGQGKWEGEASHPLEPRSFAFPREPAAWSGPQLFAYRIASARLPTPLRGVAFRLETPDLQV